MLTFTSHKLIIVFGFSYQVLRYSKLHALTRSLDVLTSCRTNILKMSQFWHIKGTIHLQVNSLHRSVTTSCRTITPISVDFMSHNYIIQCRLHVAQLDYIMHFLSYNYVIIYRSYIVSLYNIMTTSILWFSLIDKFIILSLFHYVNFKSHILIFIISHYLLYENIL